MKNLNETLNHLVNNYTIFDIEKNIIDCFIEYNKIIFDNSSILKDYFVNFKASKKIKEQLKTIKNWDIKTLGKCLELLIPVNDRKVNGAFFTPNFIVNFIIQELRPRINDKCLDLSCGCGAFLIGLVDFYKKNHTKSIKNIIKENIFGSDILEYNIQRTKIILSLLGILNNEIIEENDFNIYHQDSLRFEWKDKFNVIVGNPPYVKFQDLNDDYRNFLNKGWESINGRNFNLYFAFFELGYNLLSSDGRLGYITPNNYFTSLSGEPLRHFFIKNKCVTKIIDFKDKKIFDAQTYTALTFLNKQENNKILFDKINNNVSCSDFLLNTKETPNFIKNLNIKKWRLLKLEDQENIKIIENIGTPIKSIFNISAGIATLKDEVFFVDANNSKDDYFVKKTKNGTYLIEKNITKPIYKISQFKEQSDIKSNTLRIITPYYDNTKNAMPILIEEFKSKYPRCYEYLLSEKIQLESRDKGKIQFNPFYSWGRTQGITRFGAKLITPTFSKYPRFLFVPDDNSYFSNGYGLYLNKELKNNNLLFENLDHVFSQVKNIHVVQKILNSVIMEYYINNTSISIQGGYPCYQKNFIEKFTIPNFTEYEIEKLKYLNNKIEIDQFLIEKYQVNLSFPNLLS